MGWGNKPMAAAKPAPAKRVIATSPMRERAKRKFVQPVKKPQGSRPGNAGGPRLTHKEVEEIVEGAPRRKRRTKAEMAAERAAREANGGRLPRNWHKKQAQMDSDEAVQQQRIESDYSPERARILADAEKVFEHEMANQPKAVESDVAKWLKYKAHKGYPDSTWMLLVADYLQSRGLFGDFVKFLTKERRR